MFKFFSKKVLTFIFLYVIINNVILFKNKKENKWHDTNECPHGIDTELKKNSETSLIQEFHDSMNLMSSKI